MDQINSIQFQISQSVAGKVQQQECAETQRQKTIDDAKENGLGCNPVRILGGEDFPQNNSITLNIGGGLFTGVMHDDEFTISHRRHLENEEEAQSAFDSIGDSQCETPSPPQFFDFQMEVPPGTGDLSGDTIRRHGFTFCNTPQKSRPSLDQVAQHFWAEPGSNVVMHSDEPITYIVSITPGTVLAVKAYKTLNGNRRLVNVPEQYWRVQTTNYGTITAVEVVTTKPLSTIVDQGWSDDLYVTFQSTIGPNTVDILEYIIERWTDLDFDPTSFNYVKTKLEAFPSNFPVLDRRNTLDLIRDIAFQARCAVWISNGVFFLKYLPEEPTSDQTITVSDLEASSVSVELTPTEDLITKMRVTWHLSWAADEPELFIIRHNVNKYGTKEEEFDWFIYNQPDIILKCATFWLIRKCNTWKKIKFRGFLNLLRLETFDTVTLDLPTYVAGGQTKAIVENASYNSADNVLDFECLVPVRSGEMTKYDFFWPSALPEVQTWPTAAEIAAGNAGGDGIGAGASGLLPIGNTSAINGGGTIFVGGPNVVFRPNSDRGDRTPTDQNFTAQQMASQEVFGEVRVQGRPRVPLYLKYVDPLKANTAATQQAAKTVIDIQKTKIIDSSNPGVEAKLASVLSGIRNSALYIGINSQFGDGETTAAFDFEHDAEGGKYGAGTAFLKD